MLGIGSGVFNSPNTSAMMGVVLKNSALVLLPRASHRPEGAA